VTVLCRPPAGGQFPESFSVNLTASTGTGDCAGSDTEEATINSICCITGTAFAKGDGTASNATCFSELDCKSDRW
jgi:hypothetical protein